MANKVIFKNNQSGKRKLVVNYNMVLMEKEILNWFHLILLWLDVQIFSSCSHCLLLCLRILYPVGVNECLNH